MGILADVGELIASVGSVACCAPPLPMRKPDKNLVECFLEEWICLRESLPMYPTPEYKSFAVVTIVEHS
jgi:hypothetical protein